MATLRVFCEPGAPYTERNRPKRPSPSLQLFLRMMLEGTGVKLCASLLSQLSPTDDFGPTPPQQGDWGQTLRAACLSATALPVPPTS